MRTDSFGQVILNEQDIFYGIYAGQITDFKNIICEDEELVEQINQSIAENVDPISKIKLYSEPENTLEEFDKHNQSQWFMPKEYKDFDIVSYLLNLCQNDEETLRVAEELELFYQYNLIDLLRYLKYLVDTMRKNNILWGVGRGSSVASYCLYLLGVHRINSIKYQLDIREFLK